MSTSNAAPEASREGHKHTKRNIFKPQKRHQKPSEEAPLLADDAPNDSEDMDTPQEPPADQWASKKAKARSWLRKLWQWLMKNLMAVAIIIVLIVGLVVLAVYFAG